MPAPKEQGKNPVAVVIKFVKKANMWLYARHFNQANTVDRMKWFNTKEEAVSEYENDKVVS